MPIIKYSNKITRNPEANQEQHWKKKYMYGRIKRTDDGNGKRELTYAVGMIPCRLLLSALSIRMVSGTVSQERGAGAFHPRSAKRAKRTREKEKVSVFHHFNSCVYVSRKELKKLY